MKKIIEFLIFILLVLGIYYYKDEISNFVIRKFIVEKELTISPNNNYHQELDYINLYSTNDYIPANKEEMINIIYNIVNNGWDSFDFYCEENYTNCINDIKSIINDKILISDINNLVHPYNTFLELHIGYDNFGSISIAVDKTYTNSEINIIEDKVNQIYNNLITDDMSITKKITTIHDYIINNTKYDKQKADYLLGLTQIDSIYNSTTAYGILMEGYGICSAYTDLMSIFLTKMNIPNYRLSSEHHIWNYVYINDKWLHLDVTWDDPITPNGSNMLLHDTILINDDQLKKLNSTNHIFSKNIFTLKN